MTRRIPRRVRRTVFGRDPYGYDRYRLPYPERVYKILTSRCGLHRGAAVFEIGPGTGIATRELLRRGADPLTLIEPDRRLARYLLDSLGADRERVEVTVEPFERTKLPTGGFDLGVAATSFHWLPERASLRKVARLLRTGGWWATWNNHHGDPYRPSAFHRALQPLYRELSNGRGGKEPTRASAVKDRNDRIRALRAVGEFDHISRDDIRWTAALETEHVTALWGTFSEIATLPRARREWFLRGLRKVVVQQFDGAVTIPMLTPVYTARKR